MDFDHTDNMIDFRVVQSTSLAIQSAEFIVFWLILPRLRYGYTNYQISELMEPVGTSILSMG